MKQTSSKEQQESIDMLLSKGGEMDKSVPNVVWCFGRCIKVLDNGELDEL